MENKSLNERIAEIEKCFYEEHPLADLSVNIGAMDKSDVADLIEKMFGIIKELQNPYDKGFRKGLNGRNSLIGELKAKIDSLSSLERDGFNHIKKLEAKLKELESQMSWQPIELVPKDGTEILLLTSADQIVEGYFSKNGQEWISILHYDAYDKRHEVVFSGFTPTHFMPLPKSPTQIKKEND